MVVFLVMLMACAVGARAELLDTKGTFRGLYHVNRAGLARFNCFVVPQHLRQAMAAYEDKYIEVDVLKAVQTMNPGPSVIERTGKVTVLPKPPVEIKLRTAPAGDGKDGGFDVIYAFTNTGTEDVTLDARNISAGILGYPAATDSDHFLSSATGYTSRQLSFGDTRYPLCQRWHFLSSGAPGERTHFHTIEVRLRAGETVPFAIHGVVLEPGEYEAVATGSLTLRDGTQVPIAASMPLDLPLPKPAAKPANSLRIQSQVSVDDEWYVVRATLFPASRGEAFIFARGQDKECFLTGLLQLISTSGDVIQPEIDWNEPNGPWHRTRVAKTGVPFSFRIRQADLFARDRIAGIALWTVTAQGVEKLMVSDALPEPKRNALPAWGQKSGGCRLRINVPAGEFSVLRKFTISFQAESDQQMADIFWMDKNHYATNVVVAIDGVPCRDILSTRITDEIVYKFPFQGQITLASLGKIPPGKHTLTLSIKGDPGIYTNLRDERFRKLDGALISNPVQFSVVPD